MARNAANAEGWEPHLADSQDAPGHCAAGVQRFELNDQANRESFERELERNVRHRKDQEGLRGQVTLRCLDRPGRYLHISCWRSFANLSHAIRTSTSCARLGRLAAVEPGQAVGVGLMGAGRTLADAAHAMLVEALLDGEAAQFELDFGSVVGQFLHDPGFGGGLLLRSTNDPYGYLGLIWWNSAERRDDALHGDRFLALRQRLEDSTARLTVERVQVAGEAPRP